MALPYHPNTHLTSSGVHVNYADLSSFGVIQFTGIDAQTFLQGQVTCDVKKITPQASLLGAHCNLKGRMQSLFRLFMPAENQYWMLLPTTMIAATFKDFKKYAMFSKVELTDISADVSLFGVWDADAASLPSDAYVCQIQSEPNRFIAVVANEKKNALVNAQKRTQADWELLEVMAGMPMVYPETMDQLLPHHVNLVALDGVSFDKGCYLGQEIIARMQWRGKIKKHMWIAKVGSVQMPKAGDLVVAENAQTNEEPGVVVRVAANDTGFVLLVILEDQHGNVRLGNGEGAPLIVMPA